MNVTGQSNRDRNASAVRFNFDPPEVYVVNPKPYDADGQLVTVLGVNFGNQVWTLL